MQKENSMGVKRCKGAFVLFYTLWGCEFAGIHPAVPGFPHRTSGTSPALG
jgi:hypothetical protein